MFLWRLRGRQIVERKVSLPSPEEEGSWFRHHRRNAELLFLGSGESIEVGRSSVFKRCNFICYPHVNCTVEVLPSTWTIVLAAVCVRGRLSKADLVDVDDIVFLHLGLLWQWNEDISSMHHQTWASPRGARGVRIAIRRCEASRSHGFFIRISSNPPAMA